MSTIATASAEWSKRPADERFTSLFAMRAKADHAHHTSRSVIVSNRRFDLVPGHWGAASSLSSEPGAPVFHASESANGLAVVSDKGHAYRPSHWAFGQLAALAGAPASYLRKLPSAMAADCLNYGLKHLREPEDIGLLLQRNGDATVRAATGPNYGRIWDANILRALTETYGDGVNGRFRVPGEFGRAVPVTADNTTLYAGDRDMFVFLCDEVNRIEMPNRRNGEAGALARGFFMWNSEVGSRTFGIATFLFDYVCRNRIVWGAENHQSITIRHTASAPDKWLEQLQPALRSYADASTEGVLDIVKAAQAARIAKVESGDVTEAVASFLAKRFSRSQAAAIQEAHMLEEGRPIETLWDASVGVTALAKGITWQAERVELETKGGELLALAVR